MGEGLSGWVAQNNMPIVNGNPSVEPGYLKDPSIFSTLRSALAMPLEGPNGVIGVLALYSRQKDHFTKDQLRVGKAITCKLAISIENALKFRQVEKSATIDGLTGLPNARSLFLHLDNELERCRREGSSLTVLVTDLDGFKQVNDRFGHLEGNRILQMVAKGLQDGCRSYDYVARMGGDEFILVLPGCEPQMLEARLRHFDEMVSEVGWQVCGDRVMGLSVGASFCPEDGKDAEQLLTEADRRMYKVKQNRKRPTVVNNRMLDITTRPTALIQ